MRTRILAIVCVLLVTAALCLWWQSGWKATLNRELHRYSEGRGPILLDPLVISLRMHYTVPAKTAKILETGQREELLPYLTELRRRADPAEQIMVREWIEIVSKGLRGKPQTASYGDGFNTETVAVYDYYVPMLPFRRHL